MLANFEHPPYFNTPFDAIQWMKRSVYHITRLRVGKENGNLVLQPFSLGTGILARNKKMLTCAHVVNDLAGKQEEGLHKDDDVYLLIYRDEMGKYHRASLQFKLNESLHIYQDIDLAIFSLPKNFYSAEGKYFLHPDHHAKLSIKPRGLGYDAAILGYPLQKIKIKNQGIDYSAICLRADKGVVNQRMIKSNQYTYEFTMPFYSGNSGGPVFDIKTGEVFAMVQGFRVFPQPMSFNGTTTVMDTSRKYSIAFPLNMFETALREHKIID